MAKQQKVSDEQLLQWDFETALRHVPLGRTLFNQLVISGRIRSRRAGNKRLFDPAQIKEDLLNL